MRRITSLFVGLMVFVGAGSATAQVDCTAGCTTIKHGLGIKQDYRKDEYPPEQFRWLVEDMGPNIGGVSYFVSRADYNTGFSTTQGTCGPERNLSPVPGMVFLKEQTGCTPTGTGPTCVGGANAGKDCHVNVNPTVAGIECPGGTCTDSGGGCRVEIPLDTADGGRTPPETTSELKIFTTTAQATVPGSNPPNFYNLTAQTGNTFGGSSDDDNPLCPITNIRRKPSMATRYLLPEARRIAAGLPVGATFLRWDSAFGLTNAAGCTDATCQRANNATNFRFHTDDTRLCCNPNQSGDCRFVLGQNSPEYPLLTNRRCETSTRPFTNDDNIITDWLFVGGRNSAFYTDPDFINPGQMSGQCKNDRFTPCYTTAANAACTANHAPFVCCTGAGAGTCGDPCPAQGDTCDLREPGMRVQVTGGYDSNGDTRRDICGYALYVLRGTPNQHCTLLPRMQYDGDPGFNCAVSNYGIDHRWDDNCDGVADYQDLCSFVTEWNQTADGNGDCADGIGGDCRGDECECGDMVGGGVNPVGSPFQVGDGRITVSDLVAVNTAIFNPADSTKRALLADANNDVNVNVSDIIAINKEIFTPDSSICRQVTPRLCGSFCLGGTNAGKSCTTVADCPGTGTSCSAVPSPCCGDGAVSGGEPCDDGNLSPSDGCNGSCRIEFNFKCNPGSPSKCCPISTPGACP